MAQSHALVLVHIVFSTKSRRPFLQTTEVRSQTHAYLTGTLRGLDCAPLEVGGVEDHVDILCGLSRKISLSELVKNLKTSSSKILKGKVHDCFSWQNGYGAFSVSQSASKSVLSYIADQKIHYRRITFQEEFRAAEQTRNLF
jgi:putative transposase